MWHHWLWAAYHQSCLTQHLQTVMVDLLIAHHSRENHLAQPLLVPVLLLYFDRWVELAQSADTVSWSMSIKHSTSTQKVKGTFIYRHLEGNQNSSGLQCEVAYWPALAVGSPAKLATAHCPNKRTLDPQSARKTHLCPSQPHCGLHAAVFSGNNSLFS